MWLLILTLSVADMTITTKIETYSTQAECNSELTRIDGEMVKAYAPVKDWVLECRYIVRGTPL